MGSPSPSCPHCGRNDTVSEVNSLHGRYFCACNALFSGSEREWHLWSKVRARNVERRQRPPMPTPKALKHNKLSVPEMVELAANMPAYHAAKTNGGVRA